MKLLDLGCGLRPRPPDADWPCVVTLDRARLPGVQVVHDLDAYPWPFADGEFGCVQAYDVLEHLADPVRAMEEIHRIVVPQRPDGNPGTVAIRVPVAGSVNASTDPTHRRGFTARSFDWFDPSREACREQPHVTRARFRVDRIEYETPPGESVRLDPSHPLGMPAWALRRIAAHAPGVNLLVFLSRLPT